MQKTMKKTLSIILAILMIVTMLPMAVLPASAASKTKDGFKFDVIYGVCKYCEKNHAADNVIIKSITVEDGKVTFQLNVSFKGYGSCSKPVSVNGYLGNGSDYVGFTYTITSDFSCKNSYSNKFYGGQDFGTDKPKLIYTISREKGHQINSWTFNDSKHSGTCKLCGETVNDNCSGGTATCITKATCSTCGNKYGSLASDNHNWSNKDGVCANGCGTVCDHAGQTDKVCAICGVTLHTCDFTGEWKYDSENHWKECTCGAKEQIASHEDTLVQAEAKAPTCTEIGWDAYEYCTACDYTTKVEIPVDPDAHDYTNHYCKRCDKAEDGYYAGACGANGDNLTWSLDSDGVLTISGEGEMQEMFIYLDQPWKDYRRDIKEVVIEEGVTKIAEAAFYLLTNLEKVTISSTAEFEDFSYCFIGCSRLKEFIVSPANPYYCTDEYGVVFSKDKSKLIKAFDLSDVDYVIPDTVTSVAMQAFDGIKIKSIIVNIASESMFSDAEIGKLIVDCDYVEAFAFAMTRIEEIVLTNKVSFIGYSAFGGAVITSAHYLGDPANLTIEANENESLTDVLHYCEHKEALAPTCTEIGWEAYEYCTECDYTTKVEIPVDPDAHDIIIDKAVAPNCANTGLTEGQHCSRCNNATIAQEVIPALNHKDTLVQVEAKAPSCTEIGWDAYEYCTACDYTTYVEIPENGHTPLDAVRENEVASKCGLAGSYDLVVYCDCGEELDRDKFTVEALKHSFTKYEVTEEAKCGVEGKEVAYCDHGCGETDEKAIEALEHLFLDYIYNEDATCTADGTKTAECIYGCGETDTVTAEDTMLNHADEDGDKICDDCETEIKDVCPDCGGPAHEETGVPQYICMLITLIKLVVSLVKALQSVA